MFAKITAMFERWEQRREIEDLSDREVADMGLSRDDLMDFMHIPPDSAERLAAMAALLGMSPAMLHASYGEYLERLYDCGHCRDRKVCAGVLAQGQAVTPGDVPYCRNAGGIAAQMAG